MGEKIEFNTPKGKRYLDLDELDAYNKFEQTNHENKIIPESYKVNKTFNKEAFFYDEAGKFPKNLLSENYYFKVPPLTEGKNIKTVNLESLTEEEINEINDDFKKHFKEEK